MLNDVNFITYIKLGISNKLVGIKADTALFSKYAWALKTMKACLCLIMN